MRAVIWIVVVAATIFLASSRSVVAEPHITNIDKVAHFSVFGLLATLMCRVGRGWRAAVIAVLLTSAFGATDEWHQRFVPGRDSDVKDWLADTSGAVLAVTAYSLLRYYRALLERPIGRDTVPEPVR